MNEEYKKKIISEQKLAFKKKTNKIQKNVFKSIVKEIKNFFKKNYWKTKFTFDYYKKTFLSLKNMKNIKLNKISILIPTRNRSKKLDRFLNTLKLKTSKINRIELLILFAFQLHSLLLCWHGLSCLVEHSKMP